MVIDREGYLRTFEASLMEDGYSDVTVQSKLCVLADFGQWLRRSGLSVKNLDERLVEAFVDDEYDVRRGDLKTFKHFLDHLRKRDVVPDREVVCATSALADTLGRYEKHLRSERGLVTSTVIGCQG